MPSLAQEFKRYKDSLPYREHLESQFEEYVNIPTVHDMITRSPMYKLYMEPIEINIHPLKASLSYVHPSNYNHPIKMDRFRFSIEHINPNANITHTALTSIFSLNRADNGSDGKTILLASIEKLNPEYLTQDPLTVLQQLIGYEPKTRYKLIRTAQTPSHFKRKQ